nr:hypothetical protein [uncultured Rhodopila sp.]
MPAPPTPSISDIFRAMADRIERNPAAEFAGAAVVVLPGGKTIEYLAIDPAAVKDPAQFMGVVTGRITIAMQEIEAEAQRSNPYARR